MAEYIKMWEDLGRNLKRHRKMRSIAFIMIIFTLNLSQDWVLKAQEYPSVKVGGFIACQFVNEETENIGVSNQWKFRHARAHVIGNISKQLNGFVQIETNTGKAVLQNGFANLILPNTEIRVGYIKLPFGIEAYGHSLMNPTIDISQTSKKIYRGAHDMGIHVKYAYQFATLWIAVVNGNNGATCDNNSCKDFCGKALFFTLIKALGVGGSYYAGKRETSELATNRFGAEINYKRGPLWIRVEYLGAKDEQAGIGDKESMGYYAVLAYRFIPQTEVVVRYDAYDPDTKVGDNEWTNITIGLSYYLKEWNRLSLNYEIRDDKTNEKLGNLLTAQLQVLF